MNPKPNQESSQATTSQDKRFELHTAAKEGSLDVVTRYLSDESTDPNLKNESGDTALTLAVINNHIEVAKALLDKGADPNLTDSNGDTALMYAASHGHVEVVKAILDKNADLNLLNKQNRNGHTALSFAVINGHIEVAKALLDKGADPSLAYKFGDTALMIAVKKGYIDVVSALPDKNAADQKQDENVQNALKLAVKIGQTAIVKVLLNKGADPNLTDNNGDTVLMYAASCGRIEIVDALLEKGVDPNFKDKYKRTALMQVMKERSPLYEIGALLLTHGARLDDLNDKDKFRLFQWISQHWNNKYWSKAAAIVIKAMNRRDLNKLGERGYTALMEAVRSNNVEIVKLLLEKGVDVNKKDKAGKTALIYAVDNYNKEIVQALINAGADPYQADNYKKNAFYHAIGAGNKIFEILNSVPKPKGLITKAREWFLSSKSRPQNAGGVDAKQSAQLQKVKSQRWFHGLFHRTNRQNIQNNENKPANSSSSPKIK